MTAIRPSMNITENCWENASPAVYELGHPYRSSEDSKETIEYEREKIDMSKISKLVGLIPQLVQALLPSKVRPKKY